MAKEPEQRSVLGLQQNLPQFVLLIVVNAFVGAMIGIERSIFPQFAAFKFDIHSTSVILSFIVIFGFSKAIANYFSGYLAVKYTRKKVLLLGWILALPVPFIFIYAPVVNNQYCIEPILYVLKYVCVWVFFVCFLFLFVCFLSF